MKPELPHMPREEAEAKLTALLLGELPAEEAFTLGRMIAQDAELETAFNRLRETIGLVRDVIKEQPSKGEATSSLKLSDVRRQKLLQQFKTVKPAQFSPPPAKKRRFLVLEIAAVVAIFAVMASMLLPALSRSKSRAQRVAKLYNRVEGMDEPASSVAALPAAEQLEAVAQRSYSPRAPVVAGKIQAGETIGDHQSDLNASTYDVELNRNKQFDANNSRAGGIVLPPTVDEPKLSESTPANVAFGEAPDQITAGVGGGASGGNGRGQFGRALAESRRGYYKDQVSKEASGLESAKDGTVTLEGLTRGAGARIALPSTDSPANTTWSFENRDSDVAQRGTAHGIETGAADALSTAAKNGNIYNQGTFYRNLTRSGSESAEEQTPNDKLNFRTWALSGGDRSPMQVPSLGEKLEAPIAGPSQSVATRSSPIILPDATGEPAPVDPAPGFRGILDNEKPGKGDDGRLVTEKPTLLAESNMPKQPQPRSMAAPSPAISLTDNSSLPMPVEPATGLPSRPLAEQPRQQLLGVPGKPLFQSGGASFEGQPRGDLALALPDEGRADEKKLRVMTGQNDGVTPSAPVVLNYSVIRTNSISVAEDGAAFRKRYSAPSGQFTYGLTVATNSVSATPSSPISGGRRYAGADFSAALAPTKTQTANRLYRLGEPEVERAGKLVSGDKAQTHLPARPNIPASSPTVNFANRLPQKDSAKSVEDSESEPLNKTFSRSPELGRKEQELEELKRFRQILSSKVKSERMEVLVPKTSMARITGRATAENGSPSTFWGDLRSKLSGDSVKTATIQIERDQTDIPGILEHRVSSYDPYFVQSEFESILSEPILEKVVKDLNLQEAWAKRKGGGKKLTTPEALALLRKKIELSPRKGTSLIDIRVKDEKPGEAANIANAIAQTYSDYRNEERSKLTIGGIAALDDRAREQDKKIAQVTQELKELESAAAPEPALKPRTPSPAAPVPQPEIETRNNAFSTFSLNVSDVSFKLAAASLEKGQMPDAAGIRSEEFINAFDYRDPQAPPGVRVAFAFDRAAYPFAQNRDLLRFSVKTAAQGRQAGQPMNIVLLLDNSGSMERADRVRIIHEALRVLATQLQAQDKLSVVTFSRTARLRVDGVTGDQAAQVAEQMGNLTPEGGTNLEEAMNLAYQTAARHYVAQGINRVVLLTDGAANLGEVEPETLKKKVEAQRKQGIALDCFGIGWDGYNDDLLEVLSRNGDGRYGFINTPEEAATDFAGQLAGALHVAASDVKVQVEFNPKRVSTYRQIGYAKHQLTKEQFRDNTVDAAEIGAAESGNALYVIETNPAGEGPVATVRVRYRTPGTADYFEHEWVVPYGGKAGALEDAPPAMRLAATASAFSEWLAVNPSAGEVTTDRLLQLLRGVPEVWGADARPKQLETMIRQAGSLAR